MIPKPPEKTDCRAYCDCSNAIIAVQDGLQPGESVECLLHEVFHAIWDMMGLPQEDPDDDDGDDLEEQVVYRMAMGLSIVIKQNPHLLPLLGMVMGGQVPLLPAKR